MIFGIYSLQVSMRQRWENCDICTHVWQPMLHCWKLCNSSPSQARSELHDVTERIAGEPKSHRSHLGWKDRVFKPFKGTCKSYKRWVSFPHARPQDMQQEFVIGPRWPESIQQEASKHRAHLCGYCFPKKVTRQQLMGTTAIASITIFWWRPNCCGQDDTIHSLKINVCQWQKALAPLSHSEETWTKYESTGTGYVCWLCFAHVSTWAFAGSDADGSGRVGLANGEGLLLRW